MLGACELAQGTNSHVIATPLRTVCGADGSMVLLANRDGRNLNSQLGGDVTKTSSQLD